MGSSRSRIHRSLAVLGCAGWISLAGAAAAPAQFAISTPFNPYSSQNLSYSYPTIVNPSLPNQSRITNRANQFGGLSITDQGPLDVLGTGPSQSGRGVPYYSTNRPVGGSSSSFAKSDERVQENQAKRDALYLQLSQERDPAKREKIKKELKDVNATLDKELGRVKRRSGQARTGTEPAAGTAGTPPRAAATGGTETAAASPSEGSPSRGTSLGLPRRTDHVPGRLLLDDDAEVGGTATTRPSARSGRGPERAGVSSGSRLDDLETEPLPRTPASTARPPDDESPAGASPAQPKRRPSLSESASFNSLRQRAMGGAAGTSGGLAPPSSVTIKPPGSRNSNATAAPKPAGGGLFDADDGK